MAHNNAGFQLVDGDGTFQPDKLEAFFKDADLMRHRTDYQVVAIMGPQSSGKSTLMNALFGTTFLEMDAFKGRQQTTRGVWMALSPKVRQPTTLVVDLEGTDGRERGEDDTNFERQTALFALATSDVLLINIWCHDIGREQGSGKPLLKIILQVNLKLFAPESDAKKTVLLFVIRDKSKTPLPKLVEVLEEDLHKMWDSISKPTKYQELKIDDFFEMQYAALPSYEEKQEDFFADATVLRRRFLDDEEDNLVRISGNLPADALPYSIQNIWEMIRSQKDLNLPAHKIMVANIRCHEIKDDQIRAFTSDQAWGGLVEEASTSFVPDFGARTSQLLDSCVSGYDQEAMYFESSTRDRARAELFTKLCSLIEQPFQQQLRILSDALLAKFQEELQVVDDTKPFMERRQQLASGAVQEYDTDAEGLMVAGTTLSNAEQRAHFLESLDARAQGQVDAKVSQVLAHEERGVRKYVATSAVNLLERCPPALWQKLHAMLRRALSLADAGLTSGLEGYGLAEEESDRLKAQLERAGQEALKRHVRETANTCVSRMKDRFHEHFVMDESQNPRTWSTSDNIPAIARQARLAAAHVLGQLAVLRPPDCGPSDAVEDAVLCLALGDAPGGDEAQSAAPGGEDLEHLDLRTAVSWPGIPPEDVLLEPQDVRRCWRELLSLSNLMVQQALNTQQSNRLANKKAPPIWALLAMVVLGWNEMMAVLWNPIYLVVGIFLVLFLRTLYVELDVDSEMQQGLLPGLLRIGTKIGPALRSVGQRTVESAGHMVHEAQHNLHDRLSEQAPSEVYSTPVQAAATGQGGVGQTPPFTMPPMGGLTQRHKVQAPRGAATAPRAPPPPRPALDAESSTASKEE